MEDDFLPTNSDVWFSYPHFVNDAVITDGKLPSEFTIGGWVYVMSNPSMPRIFKVGMTTATPERRAKELSASSGVPTPFKVESAFYSWNPKDDEQCIHRILSEYRVSESREFFNATLDKIKWACNDAGLDCRESELSEMAMLTDVICTDTVKRLDIDDIFDNEGLCFFGDKNAIAEMLIIISARLMRKAKGFSFYIDNGEISLIEKADEQYFRGVQNRPQSEIPNFIKELINGQSKKY
ncbi:MAG: GIY-YIG nuclease family protein [Morganella sp. (in: enterobacteria)]